MADKLWRDQQAQDEDFALFDQLYKEGLLDVDVRDITDEDLKLYLEVANQRAAMVGQMKQALLDGNDAEALRLARKYCGLPEKT